MSLPYSGLWKLLTDKNMNRMNLVKDTGISSGTAARMTRGEPVPMAILERIYDKLNYDVGDLVHFISEKGSETK